MEPDVSVDIVKKADDPTGVVRVSLGGAKEIGGYYCVYRGSKEQAIACLEQALRAMKGMAKFLGQDREPDVQPDDGKRYA